MGPEVRGTATRASAAATNPIRNSRASGLSGFGGRAGRQGYDDPPGEFDPSPARPFVGEVKG
jgi:hypothetical protein